MIRRFPPTAASVLRQTLPLIAALSLFACGDKGKDGVPASGATAAPPAEVEVVTVAIGPVTFTRELPGRLMAVRKAQVRARVDGIIEKRLFREGSDVRAGQALFQIDYNIYKTAADSARANLEVARATLARDRALIVDKAISQQELDSAIANVKQSEAAFAKAALDLRNARVTAPIAGRIGRALVTEGALASKTEATQLALIEQTNSMLVDFVYSQSDAARLAAEVAAGSKREAVRGKVELVLDENRVYPLPGRLIAEEQTVDPDTGGITLRAEFPNPSRALLSGTFVRVRFPEAIMDQAIRIPQRAMQTNSQGQFVTVVDKEGKTAARPVKTIGMSGSDWIIGDGLAAGDQVVVNGLQKATPGSTVKAIPWNPQAAAVEAQHAMSGMAATGQSSTKHASGKEH